MELEWYDTEIAPKGKSYLVLRKGPLENLQAALAQAHRKGARWVYLASKDPEQALKEGMTAGVRLTHVHDMLGMGRTLDVKRPRSKGVLILRHLSRQEKMDFLHIYNESFFQVPNSETYGDEQFEQLMGPQYRCGFALMDGVKVGIYELGFKKDRPEIGSIGLTAEVRGRGLGRELLLTVMDRLSDWGCEGCWLQVSTANRAAISLYRAVGFQEEERLSRWYEVTEADG